MQPIDPQIVFNTVDVTAVAANGLIGAVLARSLKFDIVGFAVLAIATGLGGGLIRDVMLAGLGVVPAALENPLYLPCAIGAAVLGYIVNMSGKKLSKLLGFLDILGLGCWAATGTIKAINYGLGPVSCVMLGVITCVGGGVIRDVLAGRTPVIFGGNELYATVALAGALIAYFIMQLGYPNLAMALAIVCCVLFGWIASKKGWSLPRGGIDLKAGKLSNAFRKRGIRKARLSEAPTGSIEAIGPEGN